MVHALYYPLLVAGATVAASLTGCQLSLSYVSVPAILSVPDVSEYAMLSMWRVTFNKGFYLCPTQALLSSLLFLLNAILTFFNQDASSADSKSTYPLVVAAVFAISLVPYTLTVIVPLEETLLKRQGNLSRGNLEQSSKGKVKNTEATADAIRSREMMERWISLNYIRTLLPLTTVVWVWTRCW
ncbi:hypothetical protein N7532_007893 [Penicillium argentinense]|uniref:DUF1772-domain-containing protein n=1 Tax=Penicillium argentinense TaxID=1131581 RepID=A0A9W9EWH4_9EURO|nr:uncharacterized protein N7532_007893 [Penicillium argentinense]KAJ5089209.1 hypothetical protein N7532_007893 [Penicillium argentinense]